MNNTLKKILVIALIILLFPFVLTIELARRQK